MLITIIILSLAFYWLLKESEYLTINLMGLPFTIGDCCQWHMPDSAVTYEMKSRLINSWTNLSKETRERFNAGIESPLCGWGYAWQYRDFTPDCIVQVDMGKVRYNMTIKDPCVIKKVMQVNHYTKKQKLAYI